MFKKVIGFGLLGVIVLALLIQLVPYGKNHVNPPVVQEPAWDSPATRALAQRACFDCHSNETVWPWYSNIAPVSWLVARDTFEGRDKLNFSEWTGWGDPEEFGQVIGEGEMPMPIYLVMHPAARLTTAERELLIRGLTNSLR